MLLRQLERLPTRPIAAAWRPHVSFSPLRHDGWAAGVATAAVAHSSCGSRLRTTPEQQQRRQASSRASPSLFEELFPAESRRRARRRASQTSPEASNTSTNTPSESESTRDPLFSQQHEDLNPKDPAFTAAEAEEELLRRRRLPHMLALGAASKYLDESDFYRVGPKRAGGTHLEGWMPVGGIARVVPDRNVVTLAPTGRYYVQFESVAAARAWHAELGRLWLQAKEHTPGLGPRKGGGGGGGAPRPGPLAVAPLAADEMLAAEVAAFTLVAPGMRWDLSPVRFTAAQRLLELDGAPVDQLRRAAGSQFLVLVAVESGRISTETLRRAIRADGDERGLAWRVRGLEHRFVPGKPKSFRGVGGGKGGIMPFGRSFLKDHDQVGQDQGVETMGETYNDSNTSAASTNEGISPNVMNDIKSDNRGNEGVSPKGQEDVNQHNHNNEVDGTTAAQLQHDHSNEGTSPRDADDIDQHRPSNEEMAPKDTERVDQQHLYNELANGNEVMTDNEVANDDDFTNDGIAYSDKVANDGVANSNGASGSNKGVSAALAREQQRHADKHRMYPRFVVPFLDEAEARRFVRNWHRRELMLQMSEEEGDRGAYLKAKEDQPRQWQEKRVLNVSYLW